MAVPNGQRRVLSFGVVVLIGLIIGIFIKRVHYGLLIGLALGLMASTFGKRTRK